MKRFLVLLTLPMLSACGGETYNVPITSAYSTLTSIGTPSALSPMNAAMGDIAVSFQSVPAASQVHWVFGKDGKDIGRIVAEAEASGDSATNVKIWYVEGAAADEGRIAKIRPMLRDKVKRVLAEAVDSRLENRPADAALAQQMQREVAMAFVGDMMNDASASMDKAAAESDRRRRQAEYEAQTRAMQAGTPTTSFSER